MYKRPSKRTERLRLIALYFAMTLIVVAVVAFLILVVSNYGFNRETGTLEQRGLVQFASTPSGANVTIDDVTLGTRTATKHSVEPGEHRFVMSREGYEPWSLTSSISAGSLVWLNYARLVPKDRTNEVIATYPSLVDSSAAPDKKTMILQSSKAQASFRLVDISRDTPVGNTITLPASLFVVSTEENAPASAYVMGDWDPSGRYLLLWHTQGDKKELIIFDTQNPAKSVNVSREFTLPIDKAVLSGRSGNILYVVTEGNLRKVDIAGGTVSRALVQHVTEFSLYDTNTIAFVSNRTEDGGKTMRTAGIYREGDETSTSLRTITDGNTSLAIATSTYYGTTYTAIVEGKKLEIYKGHYDQGVKGLTSIITTTLPTAAESVEFNDDGSYVVARMGNSYTSIGLERRLQSTVQLDGASSGNLFWLDSMHLGLVHEGGLTIQDIDGTNQHTLTKVRSGHAGILSQNGTYFYSIGDGKDGTSVQLQRFRMILK